MSETHTPKLRQTLAAPVRLTGIGVHSAAPATVAVHPAPAGAGLAFVRTDGLAPSGPIPANADHVADVRLGTTLRGPDGAEAATVEHFLAACAGIGLHDARIEMAGPELPILDGAALGYAQALLGAGLVAQPGAPLRLIEVLAPVAVQDGAKSATLAPLAPSAAGPLTLDVTIRFADPAIGVQRRHCDVRPETFLAEIAPARTFGFLQDVEALRAAGRGLGASLENAVVVDAGRVLNPEGLRFADEFVRHKMLDLLGDLALAGAPLRAAVTADQPGHALNVALVKALLAAPHAWRWAHADQD